MKMNKVLYYMVNVFSEHLYWDSFRYPVDVSLGHFGENSSISHRDEGFGVMAVL